MLAAIPQSAPLTLPKEEISAPSEFPAMEFPALVTSSSKAPKKKELEFVFPAAEAAKSSHDSTVLGEDVSTSVEGSARTTADNSPPNIAFNAGQPSKNTTLSTPVAASGDRIGKKPGKSLSPVLIGGGVLGLLVVIGGTIGLTAMLGGFGGKPGKIKSATNQGTAIASGKAFLVLDWPELDRVGSALSIDGKRVTLPAKGEAKFTLPPGPKKLILQRRGFTQVETEVSLASGETSHFAPKWEALVASAPGTKAETSPKTPAGGNSTGTSFPLGGATPSAELSPQGFAGWLQLVEPAQRLAVSSKKDLLLVFGSSDTDGDTQQLASNLAAAPTKAAVTASFVPVILDFPQTAKGQSWLEDAHQNQTLARQYGIRKVPAVVLADDKGIPYFIEREWKSTIDIAKSLESWQQKRPERDTLLAAARAGDDPARLAAAEKALAWIKERQLVPSFADEVRAWHAIALRVDATNAAGKLEAFVEADLQLRLQGVRLDDQAAIGQALAPLEEWTGKKRFVDPDRGAALHLLAASVLLTMQKQDEGLRHLDEAATYEPKDKELKERLAAAKDATKNRNILSFGTGFVVSESGYLLTNHHVVEGDGQVLVRLKGIEQPLVAAVIAEDANRDMALIKIEPPAGTKLTPIGLSDAKTGRGAAVIAFGFPLVSKTGEGVKLTEGVISALPDQEQNNMYLLDMRVNPGNSGGPLCDSKGNVVGMVTAKTQRGVADLEDTYGMAIPAPDLLKFLALHLPKDAPAVPAAGTTKLSTEEVDARVSPAVMLILKTK